MCKVGSLLLTLAPRRQRGSPFSIKQAPDLSQGKYNQHANSQWQKKYNPQNDTKHPIHIFIHIGEEERKQDGNEDDNSAEELNPFLDTDVCKTLDEYLNSVTNKLPGFDHLHVLVSANLLGEVDEIEDPQGKNQA